MSPAILQGPRNDRFVFVCCKVRWMPALLENFKIDFFVQIYILKTAQNKNVKQKNQRRSLIWNNFFHFCLWCVSALRCLPRMWLFPWPVWPTIVHSIIVLHRRIVWLSINRLVLEQVSFFLLISVIWYRIV